MESLRDVLGRLGPEPPDEIRALKHYIDTEFNASASITVKGELIVITVASASLANTLRLRIGALKKAAQTTKRFMFRIG